MKKISYLSSRVIPSQSVHNTVIEAASKINVDVVLLNRLGSENPLVEQLWSILKETDLVVADFSDNDSNLCYEVGLAHGLGKPVVIISSKDVSLPFDLLNQRHIYYDEKVEGEQLRFTLSQVFEDVLVKDSSVKGVNGPRDFQQTSNISQVPNNLQLSDIEELKGATRGHAFEQWFGSLANKVEGWEVMSSELRSHDSYYDFVIWNTLKDSDLAVLGNPIPVELKAVQTFTRQHVDAACQRVRLQGLNSIIYCTTAKAREFIRELSRDVFRTQGFYFILLDRDDLAKIGTPKDLVESVRTKILSTTFEARNGI